MKTPTQRQIAAMDKAAWKMQQQADAMLRRWCRQADLDEYHYGESREADVAQHLEAVSASLEMVLQEIGELLEQSTPAT